MAELASETPATPKAPWHLWAVGLLAVLWNAAGAYTIMSAQTGTLEGISPDEAAYYLTQPAWFVALTDIALIAAITAGIALLLRSRFAASLFAISLVAIAVTAAYDLAMGTSRMYANAGALVVTILIWVLAALQLWYAMAMRRKGVLR